MMLFTWDMGGASSRYVRLIASLFMVNGIFSALAHFTSLNRFLLADGKSMMLAAWLVFIFVIDETIDALQRHCQFPPTDLPTNTRDLINQSTHLLCGRVLQKALQVRDVFKNLISWLAVFAYYITTEVIEAGALGMVIPLAGSAILGIIIAAYSFLRQTPLGDSKYIAPCVEEVAREHFKWGIALTAVGVVAWVGAEGACDSDSYLGSLFRFLPMHAVWHCACALGLTKCLAYAVVMHADNARMEVRFVKHYEAEGRGTKAAEAFWPFCEDDGLFWFARFLTLNQRLPMVRYKRKEADGD